MQKAQAVMTLFGVPDAVGHAKGRMFATFGGLQVFLSTTDPIEVGPMKVEARLDDGVWFADRASLVGRDDAQAVSKPVDTEGAKPVTLAATPAVTVVSSQTEAVPAVVVAAPAAEPVAEVAPLSPELAQVPPVVAPRSAFANLERGRQKDTAKSVVAAAATAAAVVAEPAPAKAAATAVAAPAIEAKPTVIGGAAFSGLMRNRTSMQSAVRSPTAAKVVQLKTGAPATARPAFDPSDTSTPFPDIPF